MDETRFSQWKYNYEGPGIRPRKRFIIGVICLLAALPAFKLLLPVGFFLLVPGLVCVLAVDRKIYLGPRYLICGPRILYYANVARVELNRQAGSLTLLTAANTRFVLERERFPTNANKKDKIARNRAAKFDKVAANLLDKVQRAAPGVTVAESGAGGGA